MKQKWVKMYLDIASRIAQESHAVRLKVGAVFVSPDGVWLELESNTSLLKRLSFS